MTENEVRKTKEWLKDFIRAFGCNFDDLETRGFNEIVICLEELQTLKEKDKPNCKDCAGCTIWKCDCSNERARAIDEFVSSLIPRLTDAIYPKDVEGMTNLINDVAEELKASD